MKGHCAKIYDDPEEDSGTLEWRIRTFWKETDKKKEEEITVDLVFRARGNMQPDNANCPEDIIVTEMLKELPIETALRDHKMVPTHVPWRVRLSGLVEKCEAAVPTEARRVSTEECAGPQSHRAGEGCTWELQEE